MADIKFTKHTYTWGAYLPTPATEQAVEFSQTVYQKALNAINYFVSAQGVEDSALRVFMNASPVGPADGDLHIYNSVYRRYHAAYGMGSRTNLGYDSIHVQSCVGAVNEAFTLRNRPTVQYIVTDTQNEFQAGFTFTPTSTGPWTVSFDLVSTPVANLRSFVVHLGDTTEQVVLDAADEPQRVAITASLSSGSPITLYLTPGEGEEVLPGDSLFLGAVLVEAGSAALPFFDGQSTGATPSGSSAVYSPGWVDETTGYAQAIEAILTDEDYVDGFVDIFIGTEPLLPEVGDLWDDDDDNLFRWDGDSWVALVDSGDPAIAESILRASETIGEALDRLSTVEDTLDGVVEIHVDEDPPTDPSQGDIWIDLSSGRTIKRFNAGVWEEVTDQRVIDALEQVNTKITTYYDDTEPTGGEYTNGDLWFETDNHNRIHRWDGDDWIPVDDERVEALYTDTIREVDVEYAVNSSETVAPTTGWSTTTPVRTPGQFIWFRTRIEYADGSISTSNAALLTGNTGAPGSQGIPGPPGDDGSSLYTWIKYAPNGNPSSGQMSDSPVGMTHMGIAYNKPLSTESTTPGDYSWSLIKGEQGPQGNQGIQGPPGADGSSLYTWVKYAPNGTPTSGQMQDSPVGMTHIGLAYNKTSQTESSTPGDYTWSLIQGPQGIQGPPGEDGTERYTWLKYADSPTTGISDSPVGKTYMGIAYNKTTPTESTVYADYSWSLIQGPQGPQGNQGIQGPPGDDGSSLYTWVKYAPNGAPSAGQMNDSPVGMTHIGLAYNKTSATESSTPGDYTWALIQGPQGNQGVQGPPGPDGESLFTWIKYADTPTTGISDSPVGKKYLGIAYNKPTATESSVYGDYSWSLIEGPQGPQGSQGIQGPPGADGTERYTWLKYADSPTTGMSDSPAGKTYMGIAYNKTTPTESSVYTDYTWSLIKGADGVDGKGISSTVVEYKTHSAGTGTPPTGTWSGAPTATSPGQFLWTRTTTTYTDASTSVSYSVAAHGSTGSTGAAGRGITGTTVHYAVSSSGTTEPASGWVTSPIPATSPGQFLWTRTTTTFSAAPTPILSYSVAKHGETGSQGIQGPPGADGQPTYTWIKYGTSAAGAGMSDDPAGKTYIGIAYNKTTATESSVAGDYQWSLIQGPQGPQGNQGIQGPPGPNGEPTYVWVKYAPNGAPTAGQMSDDPAGMTHIGLAYNKLTQTESSIPGDYQWALIKGADGAPAPVVFLTANTQILVSPAGGGATTPATATVVGATANTTITSWTYSVNNAAFSGTVPPGVSRTGNTVTITGSTMTAQTIGIKAADAGGVSDTLTVAKVSHGATGGTGGTGAPGADAYTVILTNEAHAFAGDVNNALAGSTTSGVIAYKGGTQIAATINTITGQVTGLTTSIQNNGTTTAQVTITVTTALTATGGVLTVPLTVDGKSFSKRITWSVSRKGATGATGSQGIQGPPGADGTERFTWIKYATSAAGAGMADSPVGKTYMGIAYNKTTATESSTPGDYEWSLIQGPQGNQGIQGPPGANGQPTYTWIKYADTATGVGISDDPAGKEFIGIAYNKLTQTESSTPGDYQWALIHGDTGVGVSSITPFFQAKSGTAPTIPTTNPPPAPWSTTEPAHVPGTSLYRTDRIVYTDSNFAYTQVTKVAAYDVIDDVVEDINTNIKPDITTANGRITMSTAAPNSTTDVTGKPTGAMWYRYDGANKLIGAWRLTLPNTWTPISIVPSSGNAFFPQVDIVSGTAGNLTVGRLAAGDLVVNLTTTSGKVRTAESGQRAEMNSTGLYYYNSAGTAVFEANAGSVTMRGELRAWGTGDTGVTVTPATGTGWAANGMIEFKVSGSPSQTPKVTATLSTNLDGDSIRSMRLESGIQSFSLSASSSIELQTALTPLTATRPSEVSIVGHTLTLQAHDTIRIGHLPAPITRYIDIGRDEPNTQTVLHNRKIYIGTTTTGGDTYLRSPNTTVNGTFHVAGTYSYFNRIQTSAQADLNSTYVTGAVNAGTLTVRGGAGSATISGYPAFGQDYNANGSTIFTPSSGVAVAGGRAVRNGYMVTVHLQLTGVTVTSGEQNKTIGTITSSLRPSYYHASFVGWLGSGGMVMGLISSGGITGIRYSTEASTSTALILTITYPIDV